MTGKVLVFAGLMIGSVFSVKADVDFSHCTIKAVIAYEDDGEKKTKGSGCFEVSEVKKDDDGESYRDIVVTTYKPGKKPNRTPHKIKNGGTVELLKGGGKTMIWLTSTDEYNGFINYRNNSKDSIDKRIPVQITESGEPVDPGLKKLCLRYKWMTQVYPMDDSYCPNL